MIDDNERKGVFIVVEGGDGAGKTTCLKFIERWFSQHGVKTFVSREPGGTLYGERIRHLLLGSDDITTEYLDTKTESMLFFAARRHNARLLIVPALRHGRVVLCDRFYASTYAYQLASGGITEAELDGLREFGIGGLKPDLTFYLDVDPQVASERVKDRGKKDKFERRNLHFHTQVREGYRAMAKNDPTWVTIDANQVEEQVIAQLIPHLLDLTNRVKHLSRGSEK
ncbi:dTMP kinase [Pseudomonas aeruginosa]|uniref:dTMP kinase n=1 Tax=Pseudomonas aeruginosa TaxID=287 RepID=UPI003D275904